MFTIEILSAGGQILEALIVIIIIPGVINEKLPLET